MSEYLLLILGAASLGVGAILGYFTRQSIAKFQAGSIEDTIQKKIREARIEAQDIILRTRDKAVKILDSAKKNVDEKEHEANSLQRNLERKRGVLEQKLIDFRREENRLKEELEKVGELKRKIEEISNQRKKELERISGLSKEKVKEELIKEAERDYQKEIQEKVLKMEREGEKRLENKAKEILALVMQRSVSPLVSELTTASVSLSDDEIKGRIIGKEGRNIKAFETATGVELIVDETPNVVFLSSFDTLRRETAKIALLRLIKDGRIQPGRIEEIVEKVKKEMPERVQKIGEEAAFEAEVFGLDSKLHQLLGRLRFRLSFGQNVLDHSLEVAFLAEALAYEIGADPKIAKKAGLLHDIGKAIDTQVEGSHVEIGIRVLEKFGLEEGVIKAMRSHHEDYAYESVEAMLVQVADAISASRPGARKGNTEEYLKRLEELEKIALRSPEVKNAYAIEAGREIRVFVKSEEIDDLGAKKLAKEIAKSIEEEMRYPGEIKVNVIRETRVIEYAR
ncbi:MAG: ribonuclease Y [Patescibacteria group bacterium]